MSLKNAPTFVVAELYGYSFLDVCPSDHSVVARDCYINLSISSSIYIYIYAKTRTDQKKLDISLVLCQFCLYSWDMGVEEHRCTK